MDVPTPQVSDSPPKIAYDPEWLAITRAFHPYLSLSHMQRAFPSEQEVRELVRQSREWIDANVFSGESTENAVQAKSNKAILEIEEIQKFVMTAPGPGKEHEMGGKFSQRMSVCCMMHIGTDLYTQPHGTPTPRPRHFVGCWAWKTSSTRLLKALSPP